MYYDRIYCHKIYKFGWILIFANSRFHIWFDQHILWPICAKLKVSEYVYKFLFYSYYYSYICFDGAHGKAVFELIMNLKDSPIATSFWIAIEPLATINVISINKVKYERTQYSSIVYKSIPIPFYQSPNKHAHFVQFFAVSDCLYIIPLSYDIY